MLEGLIMFLNEHPIMAALIASVLLFALGQVLSLFSKRASSKRKNRFGTSSAKRSRPESDDLFGDYLSDFRILTEPEPCGAAEPVPVILTIGYELNREWVTFPYEGQDIRIGSGSYCELRLPAEDGVQELHAVVRRTGTQFYLQPDQKSIISLNGRRIKKSTTLTNGEVVTLGKYDLKIFLEE